MPYNDNDMIYDDTFEQYVLTKSFPMNKIAMPENIITELGKGQFLEKLCYEVSDDIYNYIYTQGFQEDQAKKKYAIENYEEERKIIKMAMLAQFRYYIRSNGGMLKDMTGVDLRRSKVIDIGELRGERSIAKPAIDQLKRSRYLLKSSRLNIYQMQAENRDV